MNAHEKGIQAAVDVWGGFHSHAEIEHILSAYLEASGMVMVPREPTEEIMDKACAAWVGLYPGYEGEKPQPKAGEVVTAIYRAAVSFPSPFSQANTEGEGND
jgi:hypothetical protein